MDNNNMLKLCRLCLVKDDVNIPIFEEQGDIRQIFLKISSCLPVKVSRDDQLPKKICDGCSYKLDMLYEFWNTSANAEKQLLTWLGEAGMSSQMADGTISAVAQQIKPADAFVKQETIDPPDIHMDDDDDDDEEDKDYMKQEDNSNNVEEPPPKRARRTAAVKAAIALDQNSDDDDDSGEPMTKVEDDSEDSDNEDHEPAFVDVPSTSADDQPGPSGVGKDGVEAPQEEVKLLSSWNRIITSHSISSSHNVQCTSDESPINEDQKPLYFVESYKNPFDYTALAEKKLPRNASRYRRLFRTPTKTKIWKCELCSETRTTIEALLDHYEMHKKMRDELNDTEDSFSCPVCKFTFDDVEKFKRHVTLKHGPKEYFCDICKYGLANYVFLTVHNAIQHNEDHETLICAACKRFSTISNDELMNHIEVEHKTDNFFCDECEDSFISKEWFENHKIFHVKSQITRYGEDRNSSAVKSHIQKGSNSNETSSKENIKDIIYRKFHCKDCKQTFPYNKNLERHLCLIHGINKESSSSNVLGKTFDKQNA
ncbi:zinc finger and BTB domain-containing protein 41-like isoform X28 [Diorhabda carinulata]|uniref:zinc finger and BTB domain-containing protein 41-like isoform X28 n=1 Tax=Diorhabda carinulata TaxID=1163345 RepID=UPI0025A1F3B0|nr:zinc finger and BTB domain-containing protein 41-like isoform X28 [Diorhabda carinulata]